MIPDFQQHPHYYRNDFQQIVFLWFWPHRTLIFLSTILYYGWLEGFAKIEKKFRKRRIASAGRRKNRSFNSSSKHYISTQWYEKRVIVVLPRYFTAGHQLLIAAEFKFKGPNVSGNSQRNVYAVFAASNQRITLFHVIDAYRPSCP